MNNHNNTTDVNLPYEIGYTSGYGAGCLRMEGPIPSWEKFVPSWADDAALADQLRKGFRVGYADAVQNDGVVNAAGVGRWFGVGPGAVYSWLQRYPNTPTPINRDAGHRVWRGSSKRAWVKWYETEGPGRPSGPVYASRRKGGK